MKTSTFGTRTKTGSGRSEASQHPKTKLYVVKASHHHQGVRKFREFVVDAPVVPPAAYAQHWRFVGVTFQAVGSYK
jgi:hypothetical protein